MPIRFAVPLAVFLVALLLGVSGCATIYGSAVDERTVSQQTDDQKINSTVTAKLIDADDVSAMDISSSTFLGHVYLVGVRTSPGMGERARKVAASVEGVKSVTVDLLEPNPNACSKSEWLDLRASLNKDLIADKLVPAPNVHLATPQCHVFLTGLLGSQAEIDRAVEIVGRHPKTAGVTSYLRVYNAPAGD